MLNTFLSACRIGLTILLLICLYTKTVFPQEIISQEKIDEIVNVYNTGGEAGLKDYAKTHKEIMNNEIIVEIAKDGLDLGKELFFKIAFILSEEFKDKKTIADVNRYYANYRVFLSQDPTEYNNKALSIYIELDDTIGQGNAYLCQAHLYSNSYDYHKRTRDVLKSIAIF